MSSFIFGTSVLRHSAGLVYVHPQEHTHDNMHARTKLAHLPPSDLGAIDYLLWRQWSSLRCLRNTKERLGDKKSSEHGDKPQTPPKLCLHDCNSQSCTETSEQPD